MRRLTIKTKEMELPSGDSAVLVALGGVLDISTMARLEKEMATLMKLDVQYFAFDCAGMEYINSSGMGLMLKFSDQLAPREGRIHYYAMPPRIRELVQVLGLHEVVHMYDTMEEALAAFTVAASKASSAPAYPLQAACARCAASLKFEAAGFYRCPSCGEYHEAGADGGVAALVNSGMRNLELRWPLEAGYLPGIETLAATLFTGVRLPEAARTHALQSLDEFCNYLLQRQAARQNGLTECHVLLIAQPDEVRMVFRSGHSLVDNLTEQAKTSMPLKIITKLMDAVQVAALPNGGQLVALIKKIKTAK